MDLAFVLFLGGAVAVAWIYLWSRMHGERPGQIDFDDVLRDVPAASNGDALLVSREHGKLVYVNESARRWLGMNGEAPHLEQIARVAEPVGNFLELFVSEGQSSFQLGQRWVEASSHRIPTAGETRTVVVMRELSSTTQNPDVLDMALAMHVINRIGETIHAAMGLEQVLQTLLTILQGSRSFDAGEICLWDGRVLHQRGWLGDTTYLIQLAETGGHYAVDEGISGWIARHHEPILLNLPDELAGVLPKLQGNPYRSFVGVPLQLGDRFVGTLEIASLTPAAYATGDVSLLQALSKPVTVAIYNAQVYDEQVRRVNDLAQLQQMVTAPPSGDEHEDIIEALNKRIADLLGADMAGLFLYDRERNGLVPEVPFYGLPEALVRTLFIPLPDDSPQRDIWERQSYWVSNDVVGEPLVEALGLMTVVEVAGINNTAWIPLQLKDHRIGVLAVSNRRAEGGFSNSDIQHLTVLAAQAAIVVETLRLYEREQRMDTELAGLQQITNAIGALSHETEFYGEITERIAHLMDIAACGILLYDEVNACLASKLPFYGIDDEQVVDYRIMLEPGSVMEQLWEEEAYWYSNRVQADTLVYAAGLDELAGKIGIEKTMIAVLQASGRRLGVVQVSNKHSGEDFNDSDARLLMIFATQAAAIIENSRLYREAQRSADQAQALRRVAELAGNVLTTEESFKPVLESIGELLSSEIVYVNVLDQQKGSLITYPRWVHGTELSDPFVQDIYGPGFEHSVALSGRPYMTNDILNDRKVLSGYRQIAQRVGLRNSIVVPLAYGDRALGELGVANRERPYTEEDIEILRSAAAQVAAALDRLLLYEATGQNLNRRVEELDAISRVSNELAMTLDFDQILRVICEEAERATGATGGTVVLLQDWQDDGVPHLERRLGEDRGLTDLAPIELEAIWRKSEPVLMVDYAQSEMAVQPTDVASALAVPIVFLEQTVGVIHLYHGETNRFDERAAAFLMTLAAKASLGYGNAIRYREQLERSEGLRRRVEQLNSIFELGHMFQSNPDPITTLEAIAYSVQLSVGFDVVVMTLFDEERDVLRRVACAGLPLDVFEESKQYVLTRDELNTLLNDDYRISESYFFPADQWPIEQKDTFSTAFAGIRAVEDVGPESWRDGDRLLVTMHGATGEIVGVMSLDRPHDNKRPDRGTIEVLEIFAHQASTTIENTRLYLSTVRGAEQEAHLNEVMEAVSRTLDITEIVRSVAQGALRMLPFTHMTVAIADVSGTGFNLLRVIVQHDSSLDIVKERRVSLGESALRRSYVEGQDYVYHEGDAEISQYEDLIIWYNSGEKISLVLPLLTGGECFGALHLGSDLADAFGFVEFRSLLKRMAQLVASSVQNARLFNQAVNLRVLNESVVESIQQGIIVLDNSGHVISSNSFMAARYGWGDAAIGQDIFEYQPALVDLIGGSLARVLERGRPQERLNRVSLNETGEQMVSNYYLYPLRYGDTVRGAVILVEDVTERSRLEQAMEARANQLAALTEVASRITSSLERDEVVQLALDEMSWLLAYDAMSLWRRNGSFMVLEGFKGVAVVPVDEDIRFLFADHPLMQQLVETQHVVTAANRQAITHSIPVHEDVESWMGVPLVNQGHVVGIMMLTSQTADAFESSSDQNIAAAFASQVAIAEANADLFEQTFDRTNELGILLEAAQATALATDISVLFRTVVQLMFNALEMDSCAIMLYNEVDNQLEIQLEQNVQGDEALVRPGGTILHLDNYPAKLRALRDKDVVVINQRDENNPYPEELDDIQSTGGTARMLVPMVVRDEAIGLIQLDQRQMDEIVTQQKVRLARALGSQVSIAIENARLSAETTAHFEESLIINDLSRAISSTLNLNDMIAVVRDQLPGVTGANELYLALYEVETDDITFPLAVKGSATYHIPPRKLNSDEVSFIIRHRRPLNLGADYYTPDELRSSLGIVNGEGEARSYMGVPLIVGDEVYGVLAIRDTERTRAFTINEQRILTTVGSQLGAAIQNARLYNQLQRSAEELNDLVAERTSELENERDRIDTLYQITSELARTLDQERLMPNALGMVVKAVNADDGAIMQLDPITDQLSCRAVLNPNSLRPNPDGGPDFHPAEMLARWLIIEDESDLLMGDLHQSEEWDMDAPGAGEWRSALAVLLEANEEILGVMVLLSREVNGFSESQLRLTVAAANQVAASINNAELYKLIRDQAERLGSLLRAEQEGAEKNRAILEGIADGVILADPEGRIIMFNTAAERILQVPREQVLNETLDQLSELYSGSLALWARALQTRFVDLHGDSSDFLDERISLGERTVSIHLSPVYTGGRFLGTVSVFRDVTREVEAERSKSEFVARVSHEFRTPLTSIKGYNDLLLMGAFGDFSEQQLRMLETIKDNVTRLALLVEDVLRISNIDTSSEQLLIEEIDLKALVTHILADLRALPQHKDREVSVHLQAPDDLPVLAADKEKIIQIVTNVVDNAFNYTPGDGTINVHLLPDDAHEQVVIKVEDTGVGIPADFYDRVWQRFERHEETALTLDVAGTGLGLPIVKEMVELHRGKVWFESEVGVGTTFYVALPYKQPEFLMSRSN